jgi:hypothetical protein
MSPFVGGASQEIVGKMPHRDRASGPLLRLSTPLPDRKESRLCRSRVCSTSRGFLRCAFAYVTTHTYLKSPGNPGWPRPGGRRAAGHESVVPADGFTVPRRQAAAGAVRPRRLTRAHRAHRRPRLFAYSAGRVPGLISRPPVALPAPPRATLRPPTFVNGSAPPLFFAVGRSPQAEIG